MKKNLPLLVVAAILLVSTQKTNAQTNTFPASGRVGIGTTTPNSSALLEIKSTNKGLLIPRLTQSQRNSVKSPATGLMVYQTSPNPGFYFYDGSNWSNVAYWRKNINNGTLFYNNGNVGIGTGTPAARLDVEDSATAIYGNSIGSNSYGVWGNSTYAGVYGTGDYYGVYGMGTYGVYGYSASAYGVYGASGYRGVVGSGSTDGVYGSGSSSGVHGYGGTYGMYGDGSTYGVYGVGFYGVYGKTTDGYGGTFISTNGHGIYCETSSTAGNIYAGIFRGNVYCYGTYSTSDERVKKNITDFKEGMALINQLKPKTYEFRNDGKYANLNLPKGNHFGLLAQEVEKLLPGLVGEAPLRDENNVNDSSLRATGRQPETMQVKAINYTELIPVMIKGMQELDAENKDLKKQVSEIQDELARLKQLIQNIPANANGTGSEMLVNNTRMLLGNASPNPANKSVRVAYSLPSKTKKAELIIYSTSGQKLQQLQLNNSGVININTSNLNAGTYTYTLIADGAAVDSKTMVIAR